MLCWEGRETCPFQIAAIASVDIADPIDPTSRPCRRARAAHRRCLLRPICQQESDTSGHKACRNIVRRHCFSTG